jgi:hypothetical protein
MLLVFPPVAKPGEPPAGIAKLAGALKARDVPCTLLDANIEGLLWLLQQQRTARDTWSRRADRDVQKNIVALRAPETYQSLARYSRAVKDLNRALELSVPDGTTITLADYQDEQLSPVRSADLIRAAERPEKNCFYPYFSNRLHGILEKGSIRVIGFSLNYLSQALCTFSMIGFVRREFPGIRIVLGGGLVTSWMKGPGWSSPFGNMVDHLIAGPGELPLLELFNATSSRGHYTPDYSGLPREKYLSPGFVLPYSASSGCYWSKCSFCPEKAEENQYVPIGAHQSIADLDALIGQINPVLVHLLDNAVSPSLLQKLTEKPLAAPWYGFVRIEKILADRNFCKALKRSGCRMLKIGLESGDQSVLDKLEKGVDLETASQALRNLREAGIGTYVYLLFGTPAETIAEARKTLEFVVQHQDCVTCLNLAIFNMPICGEEAVEYEPSPFYAGDLSLYTAFRHPAGWDRKQVRSFLEGEFKRHPAVSRILKNDPPVFTSNHAAFFVPPQKT